MNDDDDDDDEMVTKGALTTVTFILPTSQLRGSRIVIDPTNWVTYRI